MKLGAKLRKLRIAKKLSQQEVADRLNLSQSTYCAWESDEAVPKLKHLPQLADIFEVELTELLPKEAGVQINYNQDNKENSVNGFRVKIDARELYEELVQSLKDHAKTKDELIEELKATLQIKDEQIARLEAEIARFRK